MREAMDFAVGSPLFSESGTVDDCQRACDAREDCLGFARTKNLSSDDERRWCWFKGYENSAWVASEYPSTIGYKKSNSCRASPV